MTEMVIMGGYDDDRDKFLGDIIIYDTRRGSFAPLPNTPTQKFECSANQCRLIKTGHVAALFQCEGGMRAMVTYSRNDNRIIMA